MTRVKPALPLALALLALAAPAASAGTVTMFLDTPQPPHGDGETTYADVTFTAEPGEVNDITVSYSARGYVVIRDAGAPVNATQGCLSEAPDRAVCPVSADSDTILSTSVSARDGDDRVALTTGSLPAADGERRLTASGGAGDDLLTSDLRAHGVTLAGEAGTDRLEGGPARDTLLGGSGADALTGGEGDDVLDGDASSGDPKEPDTGPRGDDALDGGPGADSVTYKSKTSGVTVDLQAGAGGESGETDRYTAVERASGSSKADVLRGTEGRDVLHGGEGADLVDGRGGNDSLSADGKRGRIICGAGSRDVVIASSAYQSSSRGRRPRPVPSDCERVEFADGVLSLPIRVRRGVARLRLRVVDHPRFGLPRGRLRLLSAGRVIGTARLRLRRADPANRVLKIRLTPAGRRAMARRGALLVGLLFSSPDLAEQEHLSAHLRR